MSNHVLRLHPARRALRFEPLEARHLLAVFTVNTALDTVAVDANVSALDAAGHISLRSAIQRANALAGADSINLPAGTYNLTIGGADEDLSATGDLDITGDLTITGASSAATVINAAGIPGGDRVLDTHGAITVDITGLTITGGLVAGSGGGIRNRNGLLRLTHSTVVGNKCIVVPTFTVNGGGISNGYFDEFGEVQSATLELRHTTVGNNESSRDGGGIYNVGVATLTGCSIVGNKTKTHGGGIANADGGNPGVVQLTVTYSTVSDNAGPPGWAFEGGGIYNGFQAQATVSNSTISKNIARGSGSGIYNAALGEVTLLNTTISDNGTVTIPFATVGGGIGNNGIVSLNHVTISHNMADAGSGIDMGEFAVGTLTATNSIIANNIGAGRFYGENRRDLNYYGDAPAMISLGHNLDSDGTCGFSGPGDIVANARLGPLAALEVNTIAGIGDSSFAGDGGLATSAGFWYSAGLVVDPAGNVFVSDHYHHVVRRIDALTGIITTVAGIGGSIDDGSFSGDGGLATAANLNGPLGLALDATGNLFIADFLNSRIRRVDHVTGIITTVAGNGNFGDSGDGGLATSAEISLPFDVEVDAQGNLFISDTSNFRVKRVDAVTGIITTVTGTGLSGANGDGGPATLARLRGPRHITLDAAGNLYIADRNASGTRIRMVAAATGIITTVAGGGASFADSGPALSANLGIADSVVVDSTGHLYIGGSNNLRVWKVDLATSTIAAYAGTGVQGFSGDGNAALGSTFYNIQDLALNAAGDLFIADAENSRIRKVNVASPVNGGPTATRALLVGSPAIDAGNNALSTATDQRGRARPADGDGNSVATVDIGAYERLAAPIDVVVTAGTSQATLDQLMFISGALVLNATTRPDLMLPLLVLVEGDLNVSGNNSVTTIDLGALAGTGGSMTISANPGVTTIDLGALAGTGGDMTVSNNTVATTIDLGALAGTGGDMTVSGNTSATTIDLGALAGTGGDMTVSNNTVATTIDLGALAGTGGDMTVSGNTSATTIDLGALAGTGGDMTVSNNTVATTIDLGALAGTGGDMTVSDNTSVTTIDLPSVGQVGGSVLITDNMSLTGVDLGALTGTGGDMTLSGNPSLTTIDLPNLTNVDGNLTAEAMNSVAAVTADGATELTLATAEASLTAVLETGTFASPVAFSVSRFEPITLVSEAGENASGDAATIDPLFAYQFAFAIPTLGMEAALTFEIDVAALAPAEQTALLAALAAGRLTVAVKNDAPLSVYQAFALAAPGAPPSAGVAAVTLFDVSHVPLPNGSPAVPAFIVFDGVTGHFSSFAVVVVAPPLPGDYNGDHVVDAADYVVWRKSQSPTGIPAYSGADGSGNGTIGSEDYDVWRAHFGETLPVGDGAGEESRVESQESSAGAAEMVSVAALAEPVAPRETVQAVAATGTAGQVRHGESATSSGTRARGDQPPFSITRTAGLTLNTKMGPDSGAPADVSFVGSNVSRRAGGSRLGDGRTTTDERREAHRRQDAAIVAWLELSLDRQPVDRESGDNVIDNDADSTDSYFAAFDGALVGVGDNPARFDSLARCIGRVQ